MDEPVNLDLDLDETGLRGSGERVARVAVLNAQGFTRDGAGPTITTDCKTFRALELETERLKGELDAVLDRAAAHFEATRQERVDARSEQRSTKGSNATSKTRLTPELKVRQVMTPDVRTLNENDKLSMAEELMKLGKFRHVVALDKQNKVVGVVSQRDIFFSAIAWSTGLGRHAHEKALQSLPVKEVMNSNVQIVAPEMDLAEAASIMTEGKIGCLPVMQGEKLVGILTEGDFLALIA